MKTNTLLKKWLPTAIMLSLLIALMPLGAFNSYAASFSNYPISLDGGVKASYDASTKVLSISGAGTIDFDRWATMANTIDSRYFSKGQYFYNADWDASYYENDMQIIFSGAPKAIKLCGTVDYLGLFAGFSGQIKLNGAVDLAPGVADTYAMFANAWNFNGAAEFDISSVRYAVMMFFGTDVEYVVLHNSPANKDVSAEGIFEECDNLKYLEFSGLTDVKIDCFSGDYYVEKNGGTPIAVPANYWYKFSDNQSYRVYLQEIGKPELHLNKSGSGIRASWTPVSGATGYLLYRSDRPDGTYTRVAVTSNTSYVDSESLVAGMPYYYAVCAYRTVDSGYEYGDYSEIKGYYAPGSLAKPSKPNLTLDENAGGIRLNWNAQPRITGYQIYRGTSTDKPFTYLKTASGAATKYTNLAGLTQGRPYYYKLRAYRMAKGVKKYGDFSIIKGLFAGTDETALRAPNFSLEDNPNVSAPNVRVRWSKVNGADGYCIYRWDGVHKRWIGLKKTGPNARVYTNINGVVAGKTHYYAMRPYHISGNKTYYGNVGKAKGFRVQ